MNEQFKNEFKNMNPSDIVEMVNRCAGIKFLENNSDYFNSKNSCFIAHIENNDYGFWDIEWGWEKSKSEKMIIDSGNFKHRIKLSPFRIDFENIGATPYSKTITRKQLEERLFILINKNCPHYKQAIMEETKKFIKMLDMFSGKQNENEDGVEI